MRFSLSFMLLTIAILAVAFVIVSRTFFGENDSRVLAKRIASDRVIRGIEEFERNFGTIPNKNEHDKILALLENGFFINSTDAKELLDIAQDLDGSEYVCFWLSNYPRVHVGLPRNEIYKFAEGEWLDKDLDGFMELNPSMFLPSACERIQRYY